MLAALALLGIPAGKVSAGVITTVPSWNGTDNAFPFGDPDTTTYGQTITAGPGLDNLTSFSFYLQQFGGSPAPTFQAYVAAWNGTAITGTPLYTSANMTGPTGPNFVQYTFDTGGLSLTDGQQYALFISIAGANYTTNTEQDDLGAVFTNPYPGGAYVYDNNSGDFSQLFSPWDQTGSVDTFGEGYDLAFTANFGPAAAPEPCSLVLLGSGVVCTAGLGWIRRKRSVRA
jgi:hypothetical protein